MGFKNRTWVRAIMFDGRVKSPGEVTTEGKMVEEDDTLGFTIYSVD